MTLDGRYDYYKRRTKENSPSRYSKGSVIRDDISDVSTKLNSRDWNEALNLAFCSKIFKPDSPFFTRLGKIWEKEAELEENISMIIPEA
jgi:hypothetical protein